MGPAMGAMARSSASGENSQSSNGAAIDHAEDAKSLVMAAIGELVAQGKADWTLTANGDIELRLPSGEAFVLGEITVTRIA
jgi:hypothetical protein